MFASYSVAMIYFRSSLYGQIVTQVKLYKKLNQVGDI